MLVIGDGEGMFGLGVQFLGEEGCVCGSLVVKVFG